MGTYQPFDLFLAYGIALFCAFLCCALGAMALLRNGFSYSNDFTTILRATRSSDLDALFEEPRRMQQSLCPSTRSGLSCRTEERRGSGSGVCAEVMREWVERVEILVRTWFFVAQKGSLDTVLGMLSDERKFCLHCQKIT